MADKALIVDIPRSEEDLKVCVQMYIAKGHGDFMVPDFYVALKKLTSYVRGGGFLRVVRDEGKIVAFIVGVLAGNMHTDLRVFSQEYFCSNTSPAKAVRCVKMLHEALFKEASMRQADIVVSRGSHLDPDNKFANILQTFGWERKGYVCYKYLSADRKPRSVNFS
jgi:hypothetical protein